MTAKKFTPLQTHKKNDRHIICLAKIDPVIKMPANEEGIHEFRVLTKKLKAQLQLHLHSLNLADDQRKKEKKDISQLKKSSKTLANFRDQDVMIHLYKKYLKNNSQLPGKEIKIINLWKNKLKRKKAQSKDQREKLFSSVKKYPTRIPSLIKKDTLYLPTKEAIPALKHSLEKAKVDYRVFLKKGEHKDLHQLRKHLKSLQFQLNALENEQKHKDWKKQLKKVTSLIGESRDLFYLKKELGNLKKVPNKSCKFLNIKRKSIINEIIKDSRILFKQSFLDKKEANI